MAKPLSPDTERQIVEMLDAGLCAREIGRLTGVCREIVYKISSGQRPRDLSHRRAALRLAKSSRPAGPKAVRAMGRCRLCGAMVEMPCRVCGLRAKPFVSRHRRSSGRRIAPGLELHDEDRKRYLQARRWRLQALAAGEAAD